jgi:hypothetical protein
MVDGIPECKVRFPATELAVATLSGLHELAECKTNLAEDSKGKKRQRDSSAVADSSPHVDVWLPSAIFRTWTVGEMSRALIMDRDDVGPKVFLVGLPARYPIVNLCLSPTAFCYHAGYRRFTGPSC